MRWWCFLLLTIGAIGCANRPNPQPPPTQTAAAEPPEKLLYEQVRSGHFQLDTALNPLATATRAATDLAAGEDDLDTKKAIRQMADKLRDAGSAISDFAAEVPSFEEFSSHFDQQDDDRLTAIAACDKSIGLLGDALDSANDMLSSAPPQEETKQLSTIRQSTEDARNIIRDARNALSGKS